MPGLFAGTPFEVPLTCDRCGKREEDCDCPPEEPVAERLEPSKQTARVRTDRRKHKRVVTVVWGLSVEGNDLDELASRLKSSCGAGGALVNEQIEIQGDHLERVKKELIAIGYRVKG